MTITDSGQTNKKWLGNPSDDCKQLGSKTYDKVVPMSKYP